MNGKNIQFLLVAVCCMHVCAIKWLNKEIREAKEWTRPMCAESRFHLNHKQRSICRKQTDYMKFVSRSVNDAMVQCRTEFLRHIWTCESILKGPNFGYDLTNTTKESAFVHALSATLLAHNIATNCAAGRIPNCRCPQQYRGGVTTMPSVSGRVILYSQACPSVIQTGIEFAEKFIAPGVKKLKKVSTKSPYRSGQMKIQQHNRAVGFKVLNLDKFKHIKCGCLGGTGTCPMKTCFQSLEYIPVFAIELKKRYEEASRVTINKQTGELSPTNGIDETLPEDELIYSDNSQKTCTTEESRRSMIGRRCSLDPTAKNHCDKMCCDGKHRKHRILGAAQCNCKFVYCCRVDCDWCNYYRMVEICQ